MEIGIKVHVKINLFKPSRDNQQVTVELPEGATVSELCDRLEFAEDESVAVIKNGYLLSPEDILEAEDDLQMVPMVQGG